MMRTVFRLASPKKSNAPYYIIAILLLMLMKLWPVLYVGKIEHFYEQILNSKMKNIKQLCY